MEEKVAKINAAKEITIALLEKVSLSRISREHTPEDAGSGAGAIFAEVYKKINEVVEADQTLVANE